MAVSSTRVSSTLAVSTEDTIAVDATTRDGPIPLSLFQRSIYLSDQRDRSAVGCVASGLQLRGGLDKPALRAALDQLVARYELLRTRFLVTGPEPEQIIEPTNASLILAEQTADQHVEVDSFLRAALVAPFDLVNGPLSRVLLVRLSENEHTLLITQHPIISDSASIRLLMRDLIALYDAYAAGQSDPLPPLKLQYADFAIWQRQQVTMGLWEKQLEFWRLILSDPPRYRNPSDDRSRQYDTSDSGNRVSVRLSEELLGRLEQICRLQGISLLATLLAAWVILLNRWNSQNDVILEARLNNRGRDGFKAMIGPLEKTVALRLRSDNDPSVERLLVNVQKGIDDATAHQEAFEHVREAAKLERNDDASVQLLLMLNEEQAAIESSLLGVELLNLEEAHRVKHAAALSMSLSRINNSGGLSGTLEVGGRRFEGATIQQLVDSWIMLLDGMAKSTQEQISKLSLTTSDERERLLSRFNRTWRPHPSDRLIHEMFEERVRCAPESIALTFEGECLTYARLNEKANQLARYLKSLGAVSNELVAIYVERSLDMVIGILGILKSGAAYVPLDPVYPSERIGYVMKDAGIKLLLTQERLSHRLPHTSAVVIAIDSSWNHISQHAVEDLEGPRSDARIHQLAYVIYTSGSTGQPKGVMVEHIHVQRLLSATAMWFSFDAQDVWTLFHSFAFDFSVWELWGGLLHGGRVVIVPYLTTRSPTDFYRLLCDERVTVLNQTPSAFAQLADAQAQVGMRQHSLRLVIFGGEALEQRALVSWVKQNGAQRPKLVNMYGITETTVHVTYHQIFEAQTASEHRSLIGGPIPDLQIYLLDSHLQPVPAGAIGEIYVGGAGVSRGYLNRPHLTATRFIADPFSAEPGSRLYKSGDQGRFQNVGEIEYLGRNDCQVKIRGFRIELGEIEAQIAKHELIKEVAVVVREDTLEEKRLVAYVVWRDQRGVATSSIDVVRTDLSTVLPEYMVPKAFVALDRLPLTPNGKLDRRSLPAPGEESYAWHAYESPQGEVEQVLARVWQEVLAIERVGRHDNFFQLGGHSLLIVKMMAKLRGMGLSTDVRNVFESGTLAGLAGAMERESPERIDVPPNLITYGCEKIIPQMLSLVALEWDHIDTIVRCVPGGAKNIQDIYPLVPLQEGLLFHHMLDRQRGDTYVLPTLLAFTSRWRLDEFIYGLRAVIDRHDILRTAVIWERLPQAIQVVQRTVELPIEELLLSGSRDAVEQLKDRMKPERLRLDLRKAPMMRLEVAADPVSGNWFALLQAHHLVLDHESLEVMLAEVAAFVEGRGHELPQPAPYRCRVAQALARERTHNTEEFFVRKLGDVVDPTIMFGLQDVRGDGSRIADARLALDSTLAIGVRGQARRLGVSAATMFHAAWALVVAHTSGRCDVVFGSVMLGRLQGSAGAQQTLGMFINTLPLRLSVLGWTAIELVKNTQRELIELVDHEQASLAVAQRCSGVGGSAPLFNALLNFVFSPPRDEREQPRMAPGIEIIAMEEWTNYPIVMYVDDRGKDFELFVQTDRSVNPLQLIRYLVAALRSLVDALQTKPDAMALGLPILPEEERRQVVEVFNATGAAYPRDKSVHALFEEQVELTPDAISLECRDQQLSYVQLNRRANQLAGYLRMKGIAPGRLVALCFERSVDMVVAVLGVLKAGAAYLPLDPNYPAERLQYMLEDASPQILLTQERLTPALPFTLVETIKLDGMWKEVAKYSEENRVDSECGATAEDLVYVIYTSGSTGRPKGTAMAHRSMVNLMEWHRNVFGSSNGRRVLQFAALSFDVAFQEIFSTLCTGGTLVLLDEWVRRDARALIEFLSKHSIHRLFVPPMMLQSLADALKGSDVIPSLQDVITAGEQLRIDPEVSEFFKRINGCRLHNHYGPTESHVVTALTMSGDPKHWPVLPSIGRPISNSQIYVLDERWQPVPIGVIGEIYIGGAGLARGYFARPELTAQRFVSSPFSADLQTRLYKTGDVGRWRPDGMLEYLGRNDDQVKIRGYRIELGEIEAQLALHDQVKEAVVIAREDAPGEKRLVAYITQRNQDTPSVESLRSYLKTSLPDHMVPSAFVILECLPVTPSGKLSRRDLPAPGAGTYVSQEYEAPKGEIEQAVAQIWQDLLKVGPIGRHDNFFELGGHSLHSMTLATKVGQQLHVRVSVIHVFKYSTVRDFANFVASMEREQEMGRDADEIQFDEGVV
jgi:amino acid adenylation domain-containing protein